MPNLQVGIDPENRSGDDAERVSRNIEKVGDSAQRLESNLSTTTRSVRVSSESFGDMAAAGFLSATALTDVAGSVRELGKTEDVFKEISAVTVQSAQAVALLSAAFKASPIGAVAGLIGAAGAAYLVFSNSANDATEAQKSLQEALVETDEAFEQFRKAKDLESLGELIEDPKIIEQALRRQEQALIQIVSNRDRITDDGFEIDQEEKDLIGVKTLPLGILQGRPLALLTTLELLIERLKEIRGEADNVFKTFEGQEAEQPTAFDRLLRGLDIEKSLLGKNAVDRSVIANFESVRFKEGTPDDGADQIREVIEEIDQGQRLEALSRDMSLAFVQPLEEAILQGQSFSELLTNISFQLQAALLRNLVINPLANELTSSIFSFFDNSGGLPFFGQHGIANIGGSVRGMAHGGLLTGPTLSMGSGQAIAMRESGQNEFVMPATSIGQDVGVKAVADPVSVAELGQQTNLLRRMLMLMETGAGPGLGMSALQSSRRRNR